MTHDLSHKAHDYLCGAYCGFITALGLTVARGAYHVAYNGHTTVVRELFRASAITLCTLPAVGVLLAETIGHKNVMQFVRPFAECGSVGLLVFGTAAAVFEIAFKANIFLNTKVLAATVACGLAGAGVFAASYYL